MPIELIAFDMSCTTAKDEGNFNVFFHAAFSVIGIYVETTHLDQVMGHRKNEDIEIVL